MLAGPSVPDEARQAAIERAETGELITTKVAKQIVADARKNRPKKARPVAHDQMGTRLTKVLEWYKEQWDQKELAELARQLRALAAKLVGKPQRGGKRGKKE